MAVVPVLLYMSLAGLLAQINATTTEFVPKDFWKVSWDLVRVMCKFHIDAATSKYLPTVPQNSMILVLVYLQTPKFH